MRNYERQIKITEDNLANQRQTLELTKAQFEGAILSDFDVERAAAQVSDTEAELPTLKAQYDSSLNILSVLLGAKPGEKDPLLKAQVELKPLNPQIVIAAPAVIIGNRPDIKVAERQFAASIAASDEAFDNLFPRNFTAGALRLRSCARRLRQSVYFGREFDPADFPFRRHCRWD